MKVQVLDCQYIPCHALRWTKRWDDDERKTAGIRLIMVDRIKIILLPHTLIFT